MDTLVVIMIVIALLVIGIVSLVHRGRARMWGILTTLFSLGIGILLYQNISQLQSWKTVLLVVLSVILLLVSVYLLIAIHDTRQKRKPLQAAACEVVSTPARTPLTLSEWEASVSPKPAISKAQKKHISATVEEANVDASLFVCDTNESAEQVQPEALAQAAELMEDEEATVEMAGPSFKASAAYDPANADRSAADEIYHLMDSIRPTGKAAFMPHNAGKANTKLQDVSVWEPVAALQGKTHSTENEAITAEGSESASAENSPREDFNAMDAGVRDDDVPYAGVPETDVSDAVFPDADVPETDIPDDDVPETVAPVAGVPETDVSDVDVPDADILVSDTSGTNIDFAEEPIDQSVDDALPEPGGTLRADIAELNRLIGLKQFTDAQNKIFHMLNSNHDLTASEKQQILLIMKLLKEKGQ